MYFFRIIKNILLNFPVKTFSFFYIIYKKLNEICANVGRHNIICVLKNMWFNFEETNRFVSLCLFSNQTFLKVDFNKRLIWKIKSSKKVTKKTLQIKCLMCYSVINIHSFIIFKIHSFYMYVIIKMYVLKKRIAIFKKKSFNFNDSLIHYFDLGTFFRVMTVFQE